MASWIVLIEWLARIILMGLFGLSIWSITIIIDRKKFFSKYSLNNELDKLLNLIAHKEKNKLIEFAKDKNSLSAKTALAALQINNASTEQIEKTVASFWAQERIILEKGLPILGTLGSTTPFVGLFGTILGIIVSFGALSSGMIDSQKVMLSLAEALILTAVGLGVAIPAVVAYNYFTRQLTLILREGESVRDAIIAHYAVSKKE